MSAPDDIDLLDRELQTALGVDPSPAFLPSVRARVASVGRQRLWKWGWIAVPATAAVTALVVVRLQLSPAQAPGELTPIASISPAPVIALAPLAAAASATVAARPSARRAARAVPRLESEVIVSTAEKAAWLQFMQLAHRGLIPAEPSAIAIQPLDIGELTIPALSEREGA